jgi:hypothetical protein
MRPPARSLRECAAIAVLTALVAAVVMSSFAAVAVLGGGVGLAAGVIAGVATAQLLRRPAGVAIGHLVDV